MRSVATHFDINFFTICTFKLFRWQLLPADHRIDLTIVFQFEDGSIFVKASLLLFLHLLCTHTFAQHLSPHLLSDLVGILAASFLIFIRDVFGEVLRLFLHLLFDNLTVLLVEINFEAFGVSTQILLQLFVGLRVLRVFDVGTFG